MGSLRSTLLLSFAAALLALPAAGYESDRWAATSAPPPGVASFLEVDAEIVTFEVSITNASDSAAVRANEIEETRKRLLDAATGDPQVAVESGGVSLSPDDRSASLLGSKYGSSSRADVLLVASLGEGTTAFDAARRVRAVLARVEPAGESRLAVGGGVLGVRKPEAYREKLIAQIAAEAAAAKGRFGGKGSVTVSGLEGAVRVTPKDDRRVYLSIAYTLSATF